MHLFCTKNVLPLLPLEEQNKQNEWFNSVSKHYNDFFEDVEQWIVETGKSHVCTASDANELEFVRTIATSQNANTLDISPTAGVV